MISNQFQFRGSVDDHNKNRMEGDDSNGMSLETTWRAIRWGNRVFGFVLALIEVKTYLVMRYFCPLRKDFGDFWTEVTLAIFFN